ncbi:hypothetical protein ACIBF5_00065 [Micromonospora sp. NPDC050417]|uniref:hypothetical protein n=1 Tax=Micromonospora sp. NPDC050417 TaxID=3364280 RepID=UPI0037B4F875
MSEVWLRLDVSGARFLGLINMLGAMIGGMLAGVGSLYIAYDRSSAEAVFFPAS